ncbi:MAG: TonB-dependent receptor plug domain-containing protein, partial [Candidatus Competibacterales bacterium]|nr:TonB-dependent receptor plug domain-containing protein [Candidatus Competibacterales bacterium]
MIPITPARLVPAVLAAALLPAAPVAAQTDDEVLVLEELPEEAAAPEDTVQLEEITVSASRLETPLAQVPGAVSVVGQQDIQQGRQAIGLDESLVSVPGLFMQNRYNFAQDLRLSIRGFGARSAFGIRGVKILVDGIPATTPDGQASVDAVDLDAVARMEVLRGPASSLYGNASGGVVNILTQEGPPEPFVEIEANAGADDFGKYLLKAGGEWGPLNAFTTLSRLDFEGFREHSATESTQFNGKLRYTLDP